MEDLLHEHKGHPISTRIIISCAMKMPICLQWKIRQYDQNFPIKRKPLQNRYQEINPKRAGMWVKLSLGLLVPPEQESQSLGCALKTPKMYVSL